MIRLAWMLFVCSMVGCVYLPERNAQWQGRDRDFRPLVGTIDSSAPVRPGTSRAQVTGQLGSPAESFAGGQRVLYKYTTTKGYMLGMHQLVFLPMYRDRYLMLWFDQDILRSLQVAEEPYFNNSDERVDQIVADFKRAQLN